MSKYASVRARDLRRSALFLFHLIFFFLLFSSLFDDFFFPGMFFPWSCLFLSCQARSNCIFENFSVFDYLSIRLSICVSVRFKLSLSTTVWTWAFWVVPMNNSVSIVTLSIIYIFSNHVMKFLLPSLIYHKSALKFREGVFGYQVSFSFSFQLQLVFFLPLFFVLFLSFFLAFIQCVSTRFSVSINKSNIATIQYYRHRILYSVHQSIF